MYIYSGINRILYVVILFFIDTNFNKLFTT
jgi:hypothetical protein